MDVGIQVLGLAWIVLLAASLLWARVTSRGASIATWLGLTVVTWWLEFVLAFIVLHSILFSFGRGPAVAVAIVSVAIVCLTPVAWAYGLRRWNDRPSAHS